MSEIKDGWQTAGTDLGKAFKRFGKTILKSARTVVDKADDKCNKPESSDKDVVDVIDVEVEDVKEETPESEVKVEDVKDSPKEKEETVFNDGSWRKVGKGFGKGFGGIGKMIGKTISYPFRRHNKKAKKRKSKETDVKEIE